jgi:acetylornithine deacetylase/succinyl-diaminopimelate desuccinylase-like protein
MPFRLFSLWLLSLVLLAIAPVAILEPVVQAEDVAEVTKPDVNSPVLATPVQERLFDSGSYLASDELEGRGVGTEGLEKAADYIAERFEQIGLETSHYDGSPFQTFEIEISSDLGSQENNPLQFTGSEGAGELKLGEDYTPLSIGGTGKFDAPVVFAGYGISAPDLNYDDYADLETEGKVLIILRKQPQQGNPHSPFGGSHPSQHAFFTRKVAVASTNRAAAVIFINDTPTLTQQDEQTFGAWETAVADLAKLRVEFQAVEQPTDEQKVEYRSQITALGKKIAEYGESLETDPDQLIPFQGAGRESQHPDLPVLFARREAVEPLLKQGLGLTIAEIEKKIDETGDPVVGELAGIGVQGEVKIQRNRATIKNVIGILEAPNAQTDDVLVIGAHYDHLGYGGEGSLAPWTEEIHPGADDNASGTASLLELAARLAEKKESLKHHLVFITFTGEERGLLGSSHYVKQPLIPLERTVAMFNMDMVGRLNENKLIVTGTGTSEQFSGWVDALNEEFKFELTKDPGGFGPSDHASFYAQKIPVLTVFTRTHNDYHRPSDTAEKLNYEGMERILDFSEQLILKLDQTKIRPEYIAVQASRPERRGGSRPYFGSIPDFSVVGQGYGIQGVAPDSPADEAGLKSGDIIIDLEGNQVTGLDDFDVALRKFKAGDKIKITIRRENQEVELTVTLAPPR